MADTRKYEPTTHDPVGDAIRAALGEQVRPVTPGSTPEQAAKTEPTDKPVVSTGLGAYAFTTKADGA